MKKVLSAALTAVLVGVLTSGTSVLAGPPEGNGLVATDPVVPEKPPIVQYGPPEGNG